MNWVYFRRKADYGPFDIFSDIDSRLKHYKRIRNLFAGIMALNLFLGLLNLTTSNVLHEVSTHIANFYISLFSLGVGLCIFGFLVMPLSNKITTLEKEHIIRE
jgi:hypothetical protein